MGVARANQTDPKTGKRAAAAEYIAVEGSRLARMAAANDFPLLSYLFDMAVLEAWREAGEHGSTDGEAVAATRAGRKAGAG